MSTTDTDHRLSALSTLAYFHRWRRMRRASHDALSKVAVQRYYPILTKEATILASALLANPENREQHIQRTTTSAIMSILYDHPTLSSGKDTAVQEIERDLHFTVRAAAGISFVEFFPWMMHVPQRSTTSPFNIILTSKEQIGLQSGRGKPRSMLPSIQRCIYDYSIVSKPILYVMLSE